MTPIEVIQLVEGTIRKEMGVIMEAHSSVSLIHCEDMNIIVDTSTREYREKILESLRDRGLTPEDIDVVVCTHLHSDHTSNNDLFPDAQWMANSEEIPPKQYEVILDDLELCGGVELVHLPGHSRGSMAVFVEAEKRYVIAGDVLPTRDNYEKWIPPGLNYDPKTALKSMERIVGFADVVVPGHGPLFEIDR